MERIILFSDDSGLISNLTKISKDLDIKLKIFFKNLLGSLSKENLDPDTLVMIDSETIPYTEIQNSCLDNTFKQLFWVCLIPETVSENYGIQFIELGASYYTLKNRIDVCKIKKILCLAKTSKNRIKTLVEKTKIIDTVDKDFLDIAQQKKGLSDIISHIKMLGASVYGSH